MNTWKTVNTMLTQWKEKNLKPYDIAVKLANACLGWSYVFGARGEQCTPANRRAWYNSKKKETIKTKCKNFNGTGSCSGCRWFPGGVTLFYDCRGFTYWVFLKAANIKIMGAGATSQYNDDSNWDEKGPISKMPKDKVCCVFRQSGKTMEHTLIYDGNGNYIHDSGEVKKTPMTKYAATHYAIPKGLYSDQPTPPTPPTPTPPAGKAIVTGKNVALREGPSTDTRVITRIVTDTIVDVVAQPAGWAYTTYKNRTGFMMKTFLSEDGKKYIVTGKNVALRAGPSTSTTVLVRVSTGTKLNAVEQPTDWEYIKLGSYEGFMMKQFLKE